MNIFVAKLSENTTNESLHSLFSSYGEVLSAKVIYDRDTGLSRRFGFVEMSHDEDGVQAINSLNDSNFEGRKIVVKKAESREQPQQRSFSGGGGRGNYGGGNNRY